MCSRCLTCLAKAGPYFCPGCSRQTLWPVILCSVCRDPGDFYGPARLPAYPVMARPGSQEKMAVLAERYERREELWHPQDGVEE